MLATKRYSLASLLFRLLRVIEALIIELQHLLLLLLYQRTRAYAPTYALLLLLSRQ
jgi:hypothetical protein